MEKSKIGKEAEDLKELKELSKEIDSLIDKSSALTNKFYWTDEKAIHINRHCQAYKEWEELEKEIDEKFEILKKKRMSMKIHIAVKMK